MSEYNKDSWGNDVPKTSKSNSTGKTNSSTAKNHVVQLQSFGFAKDGGRIARKLTMKNDANIGTGYAIDYEILGENAKFPHTIQLPYFKVSTKLVTDEEKRIWNNFMNEKAYLVNGVVDYTKENEQKAIEHFFQIYIAGFTDLMEVFADKIREKTNLSYGEDTEAIQVNNNRNNKTIARNFVLNAQSETKTNSNFFTYYGMICNNEFEPHIEGDVEPVKKQGKKSEYFVLPVGDKELYLTKIEGDGYFSLYYETDRKSITSAEEQAQFCTVAVNQWVFSFINKIIEAVNIYNVGDLDEDGVEIESTRPIANVLKGYKQSDKGIYYQVINGMTSLIKSIGSMKVGSEYLLVTKENKSDFPDFKGFNYGFDNRLSSYAVNYKVGNEWLSRYQFPIKATAHTLDVECFDTEVTYRNDYNNPLYFVVKPELGVPESVASENEEENVNQPILTEEESMTPETHPDRFDKDGNFLPF